MAPMMLITMLIWPVGDQWVQSIVYHVYDVSSRYTTNPILSHGTVSGKQFFLLYIESAVI